MQWSMFYLLVANVYVAAALAEVSHLGAIIMAICALILAALFKMMDE